MKIISRQYTLPSVQSLGSAICSSEVVVETTTTPNTSRSILSTKHVDDSIVVAC